MKTLNILTWHVHGSYLHYLGHCRHNFFLPVKEGRPEGYGGKCGAIPWGDNLHELPAEDVKRRDFDLILFQSRKNFLQDQHEILSPLQQRLPRIYLEHDPPQEHPTGTQHIVDDPEVLLVHVTHFNRLMWDNNRTPTRVIEHGVIVPPDICYSGELKRGLAVVNGLPRRGRRLGRDIMQYLRPKVPLDLVGMDSERVGGKGEVAWKDLASFQVQYRFFFNPIRYTSLGLAVCEAMMLGMPIVGLATTEMATVIENGSCGYTDTNVDRLIERMRALLEDRELARKLGENAQRVARKRFGIGRFVHDWEATFAEVAGSGAGATLKGGADERATTARQSSTGDGRGKRTRGGRVPAV